MSDGLFDTYYGANTGEWSVPCISFWLSAGPIYDQCNLHCRPLVVLVRGKRRSLNSFV